MTKQGHVGLDESVSQVGPEPGVTYTPYPNPNPKSNPNKVATAALKACVAVLERLLLDGGRSRSFSTTDAPALLADVRLVRDALTARVRVGVRVMVSG